MARLITFFKRFILFKLKIFFLYLKNINHNPYTLGSMLNPPKNLSDLFIVDSDCERVVFIAENIRAIILGRETLITHNFKFFSQDGIFLGKQTFKTNSFFDKITLKKFKTNEKYISFIHYVESDANFDEILPKKDIYSKFEFNEQNRGYSIFYPLSISSGTIVHGNFGGISKDLKKTATKTFLKHLYTPIYKFENRYKYDIVFNNPTKSNLSVDVIFNNSFRKIKLNIPSLGTKFLRIEKYYGSLSFQSNLSICRALIFKNPTPNFSGTFDVFHS